MTKPVLLPAALSLLLCWHAHALCAASERPDTCPGMEQTTGRPERPAPCSAGEPILLPEGTVLTLELYETVSSRKKRAGDLVDMGVYKAYIAGGQTLIKENAYAEGKVVLAQRRGVFGRPGRIVVAAVNVESVDNQRIALVGQTIDPPGDDRRMLAWGGSVLLTLAGVIALVATGGPPALALPLLLFGLLVSGKESEIPAKTKVQAVVKYDVRIQP
jgi:hypothetical protein